MTLRRILCPLNGSDLDTASLALAFTAAQDLVAHLEVVFIRPDPMDALPYLGDGMSGLVVNDLIVAAKKSGEEASKAARSHFETAARAANVAIEGGIGPGRVSARFSERVGRLADDIGLLSRLSDLVVFPDGGWDEAPGLLAAFEAALISAARPILLAPQGAPVHAIGRKTVVAWDGSVEAAHALSEALPFLSKASQIDVVTVNAGTATATLLMDDLTAYLDIHGLKANVHMLDSKGNAIGTVLLDFATDVGAGLMVMGGYGHSRLREFILGGTTKRILSNVRMPVFIAH